MKRARILIGCSVAAAALLLSAAMWHRTPGAVGSAISAPPAQDEVARGEYLAAAGNCIGCHTRAGGQPFAGGVPFETRFGSIYSSNITPDIDTGIGRWTSADLRRAMHEGIAADGSRLFPAFPYPNYTKLSDADV